MLEQWKSRWDGRLAAVLLGRGGVAAVREGAEESAPFASGPEPAAIRQGGGGAGNGGLAASCPRLEEPDLFPVHVGLRQGCPLSPVLFLIFMDRISRCSQGPEGVGFGNHAISSLLFADDVVVLATSDQDLQHALGRFAAECEAVGMRISASKSEAMVLSRKRVACPLQVGGVLLPQVEEYSSIWGSCSRVREGWNGRLTDGLVQLLQ